MRVLDWILDRCEGKAEARETAIGYVPYAKDINVKNTDVSEETLDKLLYVDKERWGRKRKRSRSTTMITSAINCPKKSVKISKP